MDETLALHGSQLDPKGFYYVENYISKDEHDRMFNILQDEGFIWDDQPQRRQVKQYGYYYNYRKQTLTNKAEEIPDWLHSLVNRLFIDGIFSESPDHIIMDIAIGP